ncbi:MAG: hypothetical protein CMG74_03930 [Candidatus Marinimicrobia bacterium]|nr:hypothetical protein [Candidatus Neomarinimicrobiota bacterium]
MIKIIPILLAFIVGCGNVVDSVIQSRLQAIADAYVNEDVEYLVNNVTENFVRHIPNDIDINGKNEYREYLTDFFKSNDNIIIEMLDFVASGDKAAVRWKYTSDAVAKSKYSDIDLSGSKIVLYGMDMFYLSGTKTEEDFASWDNLKMAQGAGYNLIKEGLHYRITSYNFDPEKFDDMIAYANGMKDEVQNIDGLSFAHVCKTGKNSATIIAQYSDEESMVNATPKFREIMAGMRQFFTSAPNPVGAEVIWKSNS